MTTLSTQQSPPLTVASAATPPPVRGRSVIGSLTRGLVITTLISILAVNGALYLIQSRQLEIALAERAQTTANELALVLELPLWNFNRPAIERGALIYAENEDVERVRVLDESGREVYIHEHNLGSTDLVVATAPIRFEDRLIGTVELVLTTQALERERQNALLSTVLSALVLVVVITITSQVLLRRLLSRPLGQVSAGLKGLAAGAYELRLPTSGRRDLDVIVDAANDMAAQIAQRDHQLRDLIQSLETRVEDRTRDLRAAVEEAQRSRERAERSDQVKSAFLASMSHELRTPLNAIINYSKFVARGVMGPVTDRQTETIGKVVDSGQHLLALINDILDMSKIESGALTLFVEDDLSLPDIIGQAVENARPLLGDKPVQMISHIAPDLPPMVGDRKRITQIMLNIVSNACKFTSDGTITVAAWREGEDVHLTVQDTGVGIAPEDHEAVFEAFRQTRSGLRQGSGTGLGMAIARSLAQAHGGALWFESTPGVGTTFHVRLPLRSAELLAQIDG